MLPRAIKVISNSNERAFTLLEVLIAMVILTVGLLGMLQAINVSIQANIQNEMRTQGVMLAEDQLAHIKNMAFQSISASGEKSWVAPVALRSASVNYTVTKRVDDVSSTTKRVNVAVSWLHKGNKYEQVVSSVVVAPVTR